MKTMLTFKKEYEVLGQGFKFRPHWWTDRLPESEWGEFLNWLPALERGYHWIDRADLIASNHDGLPNALVACYVWGTGESAFLVGRRARVFRDNSVQRITEALESAAGVLTERGPADAYDSLLRTGQHNLKFLGPSFFTKFLYVANCRDGQPGDALILDRFVAIALNELHDWGISETGPWPPRIYEQWIEHARNVATGKSVPIRTDAVEMAYFDYGRSISRTRTKIND